MLFKLRNYFSLETEMVTQLPNREQKCRSIYIDAIVHFVLPPFRGNRISLYGVRENANVENN
jgi:hypothetical protein